MRRRISSALLFGGAQMTSGRQQDGFCVFFRNSRVGIVASLQSLQISAYLSRVLIALVSIFAQRLVNNFFKPRRNIGIDASRGNGSSGENSFDDHAACAAAKCLASRRHFVQQETEGEDIGARVQIVST